MIEQKPEHETMTLKELANKYKVSTRTIQRRIDDGTLKVTSVGRGRYRIDATTEDDKELTQSEDDKELTQQMFIRVVSHLLLNEKSMLQGQTALLRSMVRLLDSDFEFIDLRIQDLERRIKALEASGKDIQ